MIWGVAAALLSNVFYSTGFVLEKRALTTLPPLRVGNPGRVVRALAGSHLWICGELVQALGFVAQLAAYRTLPIAAAQGLFLSGQVLLLVLAGLVLGEKPSGRERRQVGVILLSLAMVVASLHHTTEQISRRAPSGMLLAVCLPALVAGLWLYWSADRRARRRHRKPTTGVAYAVAIGLAYGISSLAIKGISGELTTTGLSDSLSRLLLSPHPYLLLAAGIAGLVMAQTALQRCRASLIAPVVSTVASVFTITSGTLVFGEPLPGNPLRLALRLGGTALALSILLILPRHDATPATIDGRPGARRAPHEL